MKTEDIKGCLIFMVWILWFQRNLFANENDPAWVRFPQTLQPSLERTANILLKRWFGGAVIYECLSWLQRKLRTFSSELPKMGWCQLPLGGGFQRSSFEMWRKNKNHGWGYFPLHTLLNKGIKRGPQILSFLPDGLLSSWNQLCLHVVSLAGYRRQVSQNPFPSSVRSQVALCGRGGLEGRRERSHCFPQETRARWREGSPKLSWVSCTVCSSVLQAEVFNNDFWLLFPQIFHLS